MRQILKKDNIKQYDGWWAFHNFNLRRATMRRDAVVGNISIKDATYIDVETEDAVVILGWENDREPTTIKFWKNRTALLRHEYQRALVARNDALATATAWHTKVEIATGEVDTIARLLIAPT